MGLLFGLTRKEINGTFQLNHNNFMSSACIFGLAQPNISCEHPECRVIRTIKKMNKPIFKKKKSTGLKRQEPNDPFWSDESSFSEDSIGFQLVNEKLEGPYRPSQKTIPSQKDINQSNRVSQLQEEVRYLRNEILTMKAKLQSKGIL